MVDFQLRVESIAPSGPFININKILQAVQRTQNLHAGQVLNRARQYPPERPNQQYERTYTLRDSWKHIPSKRVGDNFEAVIYNDATDSYGRQYANYVYGFDDQGTGQSAYHVGRWPTRSKLVQLDSYQRQVQNAIERAINTGGTSAV